MRFDWVRYRLVDGLGTTWSGPEDKNSQLLLLRLTDPQRGAGQSARNAGTVFRKTFPHSGKIAIEVNFFTLAANNVVVDIGYGLYAFYAHMRPGTVTVKVGDEVTTGEILVHVGNSGNSTEPHLHAHIVDQPSFLAGQGVPYEFDRFAATGATQYIAKPHDQMFLQRYRRAEAVHQRLPRGECGRVLPLTILLALERHAGDKRNDMEAH